ncbi:MAG TPA: hypothetical protein VK081_03035 [Planctomycetota bacterium]|nr:hypothetical protein [Planctomycetota bacterium]
MSDERGRVLPWEFAAAAATVALCWLANCSIADATRALEERVALRQAELEELATAHHTLQRTPLAGSPERVAALDQRLGRASVASLFPGRRVVLHSVDGNWVLALEASAPPR